MVKKMNENHPMALYSSVIVTKDKKIQLIKKAEKKGNLQFEILMQKSFFGTGSNIFFNADALRKINGFDESFIRHQDLEIFVRFFEFYDVEPVEDFLVVKNNDDRSNTLNIEKALKCREHYLNKYEDIIEKYDISKRKKIYEENFTDLIKMAIKNKKIGYIGEIKKGMNKYNCKISFKNKCKIIAVFIDTFFFFFKLKDKYINYKKIKLVNMQTLEFIKKQENKYNVLI